MFEKIPANKHAMACRKPVCGVGINDAWYVTGRKIGEIWSRCPAYRAWQAMLERCYSKRSLRNRPTYAECVVCDEWLTFSNFALWHEVNYVAGYHLDKDIIRPGNKTYSPTRCLYVPGHINLLLSHHAAKGGVYLPGVSYLKSREMFQSSIYLQGGVKRLGVFASEKEAHMAYCVAKNRQIIDAMEANPDIAHYLEQHLYD